MPATTGQNARSQEPDNPLLAAERLPPFARIRPEHVEPALDAVLQSNRAAIDRLLAQPGAASWERTLAPLEEINERLNRVWSPVSHLHNVADTEALRSAYSACLPKLSDYHTELGQNEGLYRAYREVADGPQYPTLCSAEQRIIDNALRDFRLTGVELPPSGRERLKAIRQQLSRLQTRFEDNLLDATHGWKKHIEDDSRLSGLPESVRALARQNAEAEGIQGWMLTLDLPCYMPVMAYADDPQLRREMYWAFVTRASDQGPQAGRWDNSAVMDEILALRREQAQLLGFANFAELSLATKMAESTDQVLGFLRDLARRSRPVAEQEFAELQRFAAEHGGVREPQAWDLAYFSEKLRQHKFSLSQEELRPYFPLPRVLEGLFAVVGRLYGLRVEARDGVETWHPDVRFFEILDARGAKRGAFFLDLYARAGKRGGAWMDECLVRCRRGDQVQDPVAYLCCNFMPPVAADPSLLTHNEVLTLFHEFGHGLHHMLTRVDYPSVAGINGVPWDAVELPSQFLENWAWEREALDLISGHHRTGQPIDDDLFHRLHAARNFQSGMQMVRQLEFALFDFRMHLEYRPGGGGSIQEILDGVRAEVAVLRPPAFNRFQHGFSHIFAGGYAAGYYSYKWAEVLSADAFSKFEENGIFHRPTGELFLRTVLEQGGARDPMELFREFRGREPSIEPLLRHCGIAA